MDIQANMVPFPGVIAHHPGHKHREAFQQATVVDGLDASAYFNQSGIATLADDNDGLCTFWLGRELALYQSTNRPLANDEDLAPSIHANANLFGSFLGALHIHDARRKAKRAVVERVLGSSRFIDGLDQPIRDAAREYLNGVGRKLMPLDEFCLQIIAHIDSSLPGVLDFRQKPLTHYLQSEKYNAVARNFFEIASDVISKMHPASSKHADMIVEMTRDMLESNFESIAQAPATNMIRAQFECFSRPFTRASIRSLGSFELKELGTIIIATYDTTALSLLWTLSYLEANPAEKRRLQEAMDTGADSSAMAYMLVLEAIRLGGSNPTALWRRTIRPIQIRHRGSAIEIPVDTMLWLDRRRANRDPNIFPHPDCFSPRNIEQAMHAEGDSNKAMSLLARNRFEINSFNMVNTQRSPRKCPGRLFSVREQALILIEVYRMCQVEISGLDTSLALHCAMPRPKRPGTIRLTARNMAPSHA